jgi:two-component system chemotaxis response regulator CheY
MGKQALVVDDSLTMRRMVAQTLETAGFTVLEGGNGQEALGHLGAAPVDLIITDLNMPVMNGIDFIRSVRALEGHKFTPILMLTTESQQEMKQQGKAAGATGWLVKPFNPDMLLQVLTRVSLT